MVANAKQADTDYRDAKLDEKLTGVLTAISIVSKRLAKKLTTHARQDNDNEETQMAKMSELSLCRAAVGGDGGVAETPAPKSEAKPEPKPIKLETVRAALAEKSRTGYTAEVLELLQKHGAAKLSEIDPSTPTCSKKRRAWKMDDKNCPPKPQRALLSASSSKRGLNFPPSASLRWLC